MLAPFAPTGRRALGETLDRVRAQNPYLTVHLGLPEGTRWLAAKDLAAGDSPHVDRLLAQVGAAQGTTRRDVMASLFFGGYGWLLAAMAVGPYLVDRRVPSLAPESVKVRFDDNGYAVEAALLTDRFTALADDPIGGDPAVSTVTDLTALRAAACHEIETHLAPLAAAVRARAPLGKRALWLLLADNIAWCVIHHLKEEADPVRLRAEVAALTRETERPWRGRTGVFEVAWQGRRVPFVARASCCLSHKLPAGTHCDTCPLISYDERIRRSRAYLAAQE